jgi:hypothetical protein
MNRENTGWGKPLGNYSAQMIVDEILDELSLKMKTFDVLAARNMTNDEDFNEDRWEEYMDFKSHLEVIVQSLRHAEDLRRPTYMELKKQSEMSIWSKIKTAIKARSFL